MSTDGFLTTVDGIPCRCVVQHYRPEKPMVITGPGYGDAEPPEEAEFDFVLLGEHGDTLPITADDISDDAYKQLVDEYLRQITVH